MLLLQGTANQSQELPDACVCKCVDCGNTMCVDDARTCFGGWGGGGELKSLASAEMQQNDSKLQENSKLL